MRIDTPQTDAFYLIHFLTFTRASCFHTLLELLLRKGKLFLLKGKKTELSQELAPEAALAS